MPPVPFKLEHSGDVSQNLLPPGKYVWVGPYCDCDFVVAPPTHSKSAQVQSIPPQSPEFDMDEDITLFTEDFIKEYMGCPKRWMDFCEEAWNTQYGKVTRSNGGVDFVTGGWGGNEMIINAMRSNTVMWLCCWVSSNRGGLHQFNVEGWED